MSVLAVRRTLALATIAAALAVAGCGGDDDDGAPEDTVPAGAELVPSDAVLYADAVVRPEGEQRESVESALGTVLGVDDPGAFLTEQLQIAFRDEDVEFSFDEDIDPWLGESAAAFFLNFEAESDGAFVVETTDEQEARDSIERLISQEGRVRPATYEGIEYSRTSDDGAAGIVDGYAVIGSRAGFEAAVDASAGESLADSDAFAGAVESAPDERLATVYAEPRKILDVVVASGELGSEQASAVAEAIGAATEGPVVLSAGADDDGFFAELAGDGEAPIGGASDLIERLPDDAWAAFALADAGAVAGPAILGALAENDVLGAALGGLRAESAALDEFGGSIGDAAGWFGGSNVLSARGALIFEATDEAAAGDLLDGLQRVFSADPRVRVSPGDAEGEAFSVGPADVPIEFPFVLRDGLLVAGLGEQSVDQVFDPETALSDADAYDAATEALGDDFPPAALLDFQTLVGFFEGLQVADEPDLAAALPYLARLDVFAAGASSGDDGTTLRFVLRPRGEE
jgi:Protein of unknown function (DUF3352)